MRIIWAAVLALSCAENQGVSFPGDGDGNTIQRHLSDGFSYPSDSAHDVAFLDILVPGTDQGWTVDGEEFDAGPVHTPLLNPYLPRVENETCRLPEPPPVGQYEPEAAFPALQFQRPIWIGHAPGDRDHLYVAEQAGRVYRFSRQDDVDETQLFLDLSVSRSGNEEGLLGLAFHPSYASNGRLFVYYSAGQNRCHGSRCSVISEFTRGNDGAVTSVSERVLLRIDQPYSNHNGGDLHFGPDGYLYISVGDGGSGGDPMNNAQNTSNLLGTILRIDVDSAQRPYGIPDDNPFRSGREGRPEIWAWGLRNVWRMSFDSSTGILWSGDVGQNAHEEVNRMTEPGNYGWRIREGTECYRAVACQTNGLIPPVHTYAHPVGESITGGLVYRGSRLPELWGQYIFADYESGRVWAMNSTGDQPREAQLLARHARVTSFGTDAGGTMYMTSFQSNTPVVRLVRQGDAQGTPLPVRLSDTGCFSDTTTHSVAPGVLPYQVRHPFWSDGLAKARFIAFPAGGQATLNEKKQHVLPVGTHLLKTFFDAEGRRRVETRIWARFDSGWRGFTWRWNASQTDAELVQESQTVDIHVDGRAHRWTLPSRSQCDQCHTEAAGFALGWHPKQLNGIFSRAQGRVDQLRALVDAGYAPTESLDVPPLPRLDDTDVPLAQRARAVLDVNCASCHQPGAFGNAQLDLRYETELADTGLCDAPGQGDLGMNGARIVAPGAPENSVLYLRMNRRDEGAMPPIGSHRIDESSVSLVAQWIQSLSGCP